MTIADDNEFPDEEYRNLLKIRLIILVSHSCRPVHIYVFNIIPNQNKNIDSMLCMRL